MIPEVRKQFNAAFSEEKYQHFLQILNTACPGDLVFRAAETPVFLPEELVRQLEEASKRITDKLENPELLDKLNAAIPSEHFVPGDDRVCELFSLDFGICEDGKGGVIPQLIELQGFPTLFYFQESEGQAYQQAFSIGKEWTNYFNGYTHEKYEHLLKQIILNGHDPKDVVLLDINPPKQKTRIDFTITAQKLGISIVCISDLFERDGNVYYENKGETIQVKRIYNRMIFDDFDAHKNELSRFLDLSKPLNVEWCSHPNWFYKISKYTLPFLQGEYVPYTAFLSDIVEMPADLENYVLKPLFSFAGQGVIIDVKLEDIAAIQQPEAWILQRKVKYAPIIETPDGNAVFEIRLIFFREPDSGKMVLVDNLVRISKGKMVGVRYNMDKSWVGSSIAFHKANV